MEIKHIIVIIPWIIASIGWFVAYKNKKSSTVFSKRLEVYNDYFKKLDNINERLTIDFNEFIGPTINNLYKQILNDPENSNKALIEMQKALSDMQTKTAKTLSQATAELQNLRFIATPKTLELLNEYKKLAQSQIDMTVELLSSIDISKMQNYDVSKNDKLISLGKELMSLRDKLEKQMRKDLGIK